MPAGDPQAQRRADMVATQLASRGIKQADVLRAMMTVPRHLFVPADQASHAYEDRALPIGQEQTISQPYMVACMTQLLELSRASHVLEVGTGSGYQTAVLAAIARDVVSVERRPLLADEARRRLVGLGVTNVRVVVGDGSEGYAPDAPYDAILVTAGAPRAPQTLKDQLAAGGHLVIPVGSPVHQDLLVVVRRGSDFQEFWGEACVFVPLIGRQGWKDREI